MDNPLRLTNFTYVVRRRNTGEEIIRVCDFKIGDVLVLLFHLCRNFPIEIECPEILTASPNRSEGYLWVPASERPKLEEEMNKDPKFAWRFVCYDLFNGVESAFYRHEKLRLIDLDMVKKEYFSEKEVVV